VYSLEEIVDQLEELIDSLLRGKGLYILSTFPERSDLDKPLGDILSFFDGGFDGFTPPFFMTPKNIFITR
jgi:hypothetical protein